MQLHKDNQMIFNKSYFHGYTLRCCCYVLSFSINCLIIKKKVLYSLKNKRKPGCPLQVCPLAMMHSIHQRQCWTRCHLSRQFTFLFPLSTDLSKITTNHGRGWSLDIGSLDMLGWWTKGRGTFGTKRER